MKKLTALLLACLLCVCVLGCVFWPKTAEPPKGPSDSTLDGNEVAVDKDPLNPDAGVNIGSSDTTNNAGDDADTDSDSSSDNNSDTNQGNGSSGGTSDTDPDTKPDNSTDVKPDSGSDGKTDATPDNTQPDNNAGNSSGSKPDSGSDNKPSVKPDDGSSNNPATDKSITTEEVKSLTVEKWNSMSSKEQEDYFWNVAWPTDTNSKEYKEAYHHYVWIAFYNGYSCGTDGHVCPSPLNHQGLVEAIAETCRYCGKSDCPSFFVKDSEGFTTLPSGFYESCPHYNVANDSSKTCQTCGLPNNRYLADSGTTVCIRVNKPIACPLCSKMLETGKCHACVKP